MKTSTSTKKTKSTKAAKASKTAPKKKEKAAAKGKVNDGLKTRPALTPAATGGPAAKGKSQAEDLTLSADARTGGDDGKERRVPSLPKGAMNATGTGKPELIPWGDLEPGYNARETFAEAQLRELAEAIFAAGLLQRLIVYPHPTKKGKFAIHGGNRRYLAIEILIQEKRWTGPVPCEVRYDAPSSGRDLTGALENLSRVDLNPVEKSNVCNRLVDSGAYVPWSEKEKARSLGHILGYESKASIYALLNIAKLCPLAQQAAAAWPNGEDAISPSVADVLARVRDPKLQAEATKRAITEKWTQKRAAEEIQKFQRQLKGAPFDLKDPDLVPRDAAEGFGGSCVTCPFRSGNQQEMFSEFSPKGGGRQDMCLRPACFAAKCEAGWQKRAAEHAAGGGRVLDAKEAEKFGLGKYGNHGCDGYVELEDPLKFGSRYGDSPMTEQPLRDLLAKALASGEVKPILARSNDGSGKIHEFVPRKQAEEMVRKGNKAIDSAVRKYEEEEKAESGPRIWTANDHRVQQEREERIAEAAEGLYTGKLCAAPARAILVVLVDRWLDDCFGGDIKEMCQVAGVPFSEDDQEISENAIRAALPTLADDKLESLFLMWCDDWHNAIRTAGALLRAAGLDAEKEILKIDKKTPSLEEIAAEINNEEAEARQLRAVPGNGFSNHVFRDKLGISMELANKIGDALIDEEPKETLEKMDPTLRDVLLNKARAMKANDDVWSATALSKNLKVSLELADALYVAVNREGAE